MSNKMTDSNRRTDILDELRAPYGWCGRAMRQRAAKEIEYLRGRVNFLEGDRDRLKEALEKEASAAKYYAKNRDAAFEANERIMRTNERLRERLANVHKALGVN